MNLKSTHIYSVFCGLLSALLAGLVMFGWHSSNQSLVQINAAFAPMQYNTALGFLLCGLGLIALPIQRGIASQLIGLIALALGIGTLLQYILHVDFNIDEFFIDPVFITKTSHPGRMAPMTALCLSLSGLCLLVSNLRQALGVSIAISILVLACLALVGYIVPQNNSLYGWGNLTRMAIHTASGFVLVGGALFTHSFWGRGQKKFDFWQIAPFSIAMIVTVLTFFSWYIIEEESQARNKAYMQGLVKDTQMALLDRYHIYEESLRGGLGLYYASQSVERNEWKNYVKALNAQENLPGINGVGYIDAVQAQDLSAYLEHVRADDAPNFQNHPDTPYADKFIIKFIEPIAGNEKAVGLDIGFETNRRAAAEHARDHGVAALTKKILLVQDQKKQAGFLLLIPVYDTKDTPPTLEERRAHFQGWVYAPFIGNNFFQDVDQSNKNQVYLEVFDGKNPTKEALIYVDPAYEHDKSHTEEYEKNIVYTHMEIAGQTWTLEWRPNENYTPPANERLPLVVLVFGLGFAVFLYFTLSRLLYSKELIRQKVDERTKKLKESEGRNKAILFNTVDAILTIDEKGTIQSFNPAAEQMFGYSGTEIIGKNISRLMPDPPPANHDEYIDTFLGIGDAKSIGITRELEAIHKDGHAFPIQLSLSEVELENEKLFSGIIRDITKQKEADAYIQESIEFQELVSNSIPDFLFVKDDEFRIVDANEAFLGLYEDIDAEAIIGSTTIEKYDEKEATEFLKNDKIAFEKGYSEVEESIMFPNGELRTLLTKKVRFKNAKDEAFILGISRDITEAKNTQEQILQTNAELKRSNHELERFAYIASHDLQEPLRKIGGFTERMEKHLADQLQGDEKAQAYMGFVTDGVERMRELIMGLLAYSRVTTSESEPEKLDTNDIVAVAIDSLSQSIEEQEAKIIYDDLPDVYYDKVMLAQLFQNLIGNAIKYRAEAAPEIHISAKKIKEFWEFSVQDNAMGMEEKHLSRIFEMFQRLHRKEEIAGTGIGLSLCQKIVERYGGTIWVTSKPDKGSTFFFTIPIKGA